MEPPRNHSGCAERTLPARSSIILPTVIRDGKPWGFMIVSRGVWIEGGSQSITATVHPTGVECPCVFGGGGGQITHQERSPGR